MQLALIQFGAAVAAVYLIVVIVGTIAFPDANQRTK